MASDVPAVAKNPFPRAKWWTGALPPFRGAYILVRIARPVPCEDAYYGPLPKGDLQTVLEIAEAYCREVTLPYEPEATFDYYFHKGVK